MLKIIKSETSLIRYINKKLPFQVKEQINLLPEEGKKEFYYEYKRIGKEIGPAYLAHLIGGWSYGYVGSWFKQLLFWATGFGFGILWVVNIFRIPYLVRRSNEKMSLRLLHYLKNKHAISLSRNSSYSTERIINPRKINVAYDPSNLSVNNLKFGFMVDYELKTWKVINEKQFDWQYNQRSDKLFKLVSNIDSIYILIREVESYAQYYVMKKVNIYALDPNIDSKISRNQKFPNLITYQKEVFYKENILKGWSFDMHLRKGNILSKFLLAWEYFSQEQNKYIIIYQRDNNDYTTLMGKLEADYQFSDILPSSS